MADDRSRVVQLEKVGVLVRLPSACDTQTSNDHGVLAGLAFLYFMYVYNFFGIFPVRRKSILGDPDRAVLRAEDPERFHLLIALGIGIGVAAIVFGLVRALGGTRKEQDRS